MPGIPGPEHVAKEDIAVSGPERYLSDPTEDTTRPDDLPLARTVRRSRNFEQGRCPHCGKRCYRHDTRGVSK
jgi:hypothetical protein